MGLSTTTPERAGRRLGPWLGALLAVLLGCPSCALLHPPLAGALVYPFIEPASDSLDPEDPEDVADDFEDAVERVRIGVLRNPYREAWRSEVGGEQVDDREDENALLRDFLDDTDLFREVVLLDRASQRPDLDVYVACSVDCIYEIELDGWMYAFNWLTLGLGFLAGYPHQDSSAFYLAEATFYELRDGRLQAVGGSLNCNQREWYGDGIYWRPGFYGEDALEPLFEQLTCDLLRETGVLDR